MNTLTYCLNVLKIKEDSEIYRNAVKLAQKTLLESNEWISAMRIIANASRNYIFSQSQLSDFLTLAAKVIEQNKTSSGIIFKMYRDIIENYGKFSDYLKSNSTILRSHELVRAADSIRRARTYIENILDNKFVPDSSHGINHIKHNLEYGYSLMNLIELPRRPRRNYG